MGGQTATPAWRLITPFLTSTLHHLRPFVILSSQSAKTRGPARKFAANPESTTLSRRYAPEAIVAQLCLDRYDRRKRMDTGQPAATRELAFYYPNPMWSYG